MSIPPLDRWKTLLPVRAPGPIGRARRSRGEAISEQLAPETLWGRLEHLSEAVRRHTDLQPQLGIVLGSGLGALASELSDAVSIPFTELPGWPKASAPGHAGRLVLGRLDGVAVACLQGRLHLYEGHAPGLVVEPALLMGRLGATALLLTNAAGGLDGRLSAGSLMVIEDHLNLTGVSPLVGPNDERLGPRFPDLVDAWSPRLRTLLDRAAAEEGITLERGVYAGLLGPAFETPAEVRMLRQLGASAVGMSTVLEAIAARWSGLELAGVSLITNLAAGMTGQPITHQEVLATADEAGPRFVRLVRRFTRLLGDGTAAR